VSTSGLVTSPASELPVTSMVGGLAGELTGPAAAAGTIERPAMLTAIVQMTMPAQNRPGFQGAAHGMRENLNSASPLDCLQFWKVV
jgi:hypothetical protein